MSTPSSILEQVFTRRLFTIAGFTLLFYDYFLTLPLEAAHMWDGPWTSVKTLFFINRYGNLAGQTIILLEEIGYISNGSQPFCTAFQLFLPFFAIFSGESIRLLVVMRACAVRRCKRSVAITINTLYILYSVAVLVAVAYLLTDHPLLFEYLNEIGLCFTPVGPNAWATWLVSVFLDTMVFVVVCFSLLQLAKGSYGICQSRLIRTLARDAVLFYIVAMFNSLFCIACWTVYRTDPRNFLQTVVSFPLLSVVGQRVVLNLRHLRAQPDSTRDLSREVNRQMVAIRDGLSASSSSPWVELDDLGGEEVVDGAIRGYSLVHAEGGLPPQASQPGLVRSSRWDTCTSTAASHA